MLFEIPDSELNIVNEIICIDDTDCKPRDCCTGCGGNIFKYKIEGKNPILQKVYDDMSTIIAEENKTGSFVLCKILLDNNSPFYDYWTALKKYIEGK